MNHHLKTSTLKAAVTAAYDPDRREPNPLLAKLPEPLDITQLATALAHTPAYSPEDKSLPLSEKLRRLKSLRGLVVPTGRIIELALDFDATLRAGYEMRNPVGPDGAAIRRALYAAVDVQRPSQGSSTRHADAMTLLGHGGSGKSTGMDAVLSLYPQVIPHEGDMPWMQITYVKVEMPVDGSLKQLLAAFFAAVDDLLGTTYSDLYGKRAVTLDERLLAAEQLVARHHIGFIIFEEVQFLSVGGPIGLEKFTNFVTRLVNRVKCPVMFIGTMAAAPLLSGNLRQARRCGTTMEWQPYDIGRDWTKIADTVMGYMYCDLDWPDSVDAAEFLQDRAQGLPGILVPLFIAAQTKALTNATPMTPAHVDWALEHRFSLVKPILDAMRLPEPERTQVLSNCQDMLPRLLGDAVSAAEALLAGEQAKSAHTARMADAREKRRGRVIGHLQKLGYTRVAATEVVDALIDDSQYAEDADLVVAGVQRLLTKPKKKKAKASNAAPLAADDLRNLASQEA